MLPQPLYTETLSYLTQTCKSHLLSQLPPTYTATSTTLTITVPLSFPHLLHASPTLLHCLLTNLPLVQKCFLQSVSEMMLSVGVEPPENGIHLGLKIANCSLPGVDVTASEVVLGGFEMGEGGWMGFVRGAVVRSVGEHRMYLFSGVEVWGKRCCCLGNDGDENGETGKVYRRKFTRTLLSLIKDNISQSNLKSAPQSTPHLCPICSKSYSYLSTENEVYQSCQKIVCQLPKTIEKETLFQSLEFEGYGDSGVVGNLKVGDCISCCLYIFNRPVITKLAGPSLKKQAIQIKPQTRLYIPTVTLQSLQQSLKNNQLFYQLGKIGLSQRHCSGLQDTQVLLENYENFVHALKKFQFCYLPESMLTTFKIVLLGSLCCHCFGGAKLHLCLIAQDLPLLYTLTSLPSLPTLSSRIKHLPSDYDVTTLNSWLMLARGCVVVVGGGKRRREAVGEWIAHNQHTLSSLCITVWYLCEQNPKKQLNLQFFSVVLDLTTQKNRQVCLQAIEETIDLKLSAFVDEEIGGGGAIVQQTVVKGKDGREQGGKRGREWGPMHIHLRNLFQPYSVPPPQPNSSQLQCQDSETRKILQKYYLKCRDLRRTSASTLSTLYNLAKGFAYFRCALQRDKQKDKQKERDVKGEGEGDAKGEGPMLSVLDGILAIFLDEESSRNKYSGGNTLFGVEISKLILNQQQAEISFWEYLEGDEGIVREERGWMHKGDMFRRMVSKLRDLLEEQDEEQDQ